MSFDYIRTADGTPAAVTDACFPDGSTRPGYRAVLRDGARIGSNILMMVDGAAPTFLTDAERVFADSADGKEAVAYARSVFSLTNQGAWTDAHAECAIKDAFASRQQIGAASMQNHAKGVALALDERAAYERSVANLTKRG